MLELWEDRGRRTAQLCAAAHGSRRECDTSGTRISLLTIKILLNHVLGRIGDCHLKSSAITRVTVREVMLVFASLPKHMFPLDVVVLVISVERPSFVNATGSATPCGS